MPIGDNDIASGVFFSDFAVDVEFAGQPTAKGNFDAPGKDALFGPNATVSDNEYRLEVSYVAFSPMPDVRSVLTVKGVRYVVTSTSPMDDGMTVEIMLRRL